MGTVFQLIIMRLLVLSISVALASAKGLPHRPNMTVEAAANCDPDYGWINGPDGPISVIWSLGIQHMLLALEVVATQTGAVIRQTPTAMRSATIRHVATTTTVVAATTIASTGSKQCSAVSQTMDIWLSQVVRRNTT